MSFRPLTGIFVFNLIAYRHGGNVHGGFRPLTGIFVFNYAKLPMNETTDIDIVFPSPYGDFCF